MEKYVARSGYEVLGYRYLVSNCQPIRPSSVLVWAYYMAVVGCSFYQTQMNDYLKLFLVWYGIGIISMLFWEIALICTIFFSTELATRRLVRFEMILGVGLLGPLANVIGGVLVYGRLGNSLGIFNRTLD